MPAIQQSPAKPYPSFEQIVGRHQGRVYSIALRITGDTGTAEEVAQDVFLECHRSLHSMASEEHLAAWLCRVACHRATDALRRRKSRGGDLVMTLEEDLLTPSKPQREDPLLNRVEQLLLTLRNNSGRSCCCATRKTWSRSRLPRPSACRSPPCAATCSAASNCSAKKRSEP